MVSIREYIEREVKADFSGDKFGISNTYSMNDSKKSGLMEFI